ncbi:hypothetical protein PTSG_07477 [Salpingoeca rosetta]|uniref:EGF-like domain-containing protein n=1 Tax=Salpingoeca rosetta (strain ATCC 50818 / BSB-021) TaxID=946362 RepID=F2UIU4_SALR5|nr:uncharacterized protein PTSG_07477 [Salpingoeca rosetta]EGD77143.1 hypothetical protein PTSG_07477 [Salpingoeca rosetta]|eukprot:XP_004990982.1 hypothetical protein PTSG_07477 [Salpingoeca rosetta]
MGSQGRGALAVALLAAAALCAPIADAYPYYYSGCQISVGETAMSHTVTAVSDGDSDCDIEGFPTEYFEGETYTINLNGRSGLMFLVSVDSGTLAKKDSNSFTSKSGCSSTAGYGNLDTQVEWTAGSASSASITLTCGSNSFGLLQATESGSKGEVVTCDSPPSVDNGTPCSSATHIQPDCDVQCSSGYELTANTIQCQPDGNFTGSATCSDIDACESHDVCDPNSNGCMDIAGGPDSEDGITCGGCTTGYTGDGFTCEDIDGCNPVPCDADATCADVAAPGTGATCTCNEGFFGDGSTCTACTVCPENTYAVGECHTTAGDYDSCDACPGNSTSPADSKSIDDCTCNEGFTKMTSGNSFVCEPIVCPEGEFLDGDTCSACTPTTCPAGEELQGQCGGSTNTLSCQPCTGGTAKDAAGAGMCTTCPWGTEPNSDHTDCVACPAGHAGIGGSCTLCGNGTQPSTNGSVCVACQPGWAGTLGLCSACGQDKVASSDKTACVTCGANAVPNTMHAACVCDTTSVVTSPWPLTCTPCGDGTRPNWNQTACVPCQPGWAGTNGWCSACSSNLVPNMARTACVACPAPFRASADGVRCMPPRCGESDGTDARQCSPCPGCHCPRTHVPVVDTIGAIEYVSCDLCPPELVPVAGTCRPCPQNRVSFNGRCLACASGYGVYNATTCLPCKGVNISMDGVCVGCPAGQVPDETRTRCQNVTQQNIYFALDYAQFEQDAQARWEFIGAVLEALQAHGIDTSAIVQVLLRPGSTVVELVGAGWALQAAKDAAAAGTVVVVHNGANATAGDTLTADGTVVSSSVEGSTDSSGSSGGGASTTEDLSAGTVAGVFAGVFAGAFVVFLIAACQTKSRHVMHSKRSTSKLEIDLTTEDGDVSSASSPWDNVQVSDL